MHFENQQQAIEILNPYHHQRGLFFFDQGILVDKEGRSSFLIHEVMDKLPIQVDAAHIHDNLVALNCNYNIDEQALASGHFQIIPVKSYLTHADVVHQMQVFKAFHWLNWDLNSQFCGRCGMSLSKQIDSIEKKCIQCDTSIFPKMSPAVMVLIYRDKEILLARSWHFKAGMFSAVAGFIELGESAETAAHREVKEELGVEITDLEYFGTQVWPFPDSFMIAFKARHLKGDLAIDKVEIEEAKWFDKASLPILPPSASISRSLIESVIATW